MNFKESIQQNHQQHVWENFLRWTSMKLKKTTNENFNFIKKETRTLGKLFWLALASLVMKQPRGRSSHRFISSPSPCGGRPGTWCPVGPRFPFVVGGDIVLRSRLAQLRRFVWVSNVSIISILSRGVFLDVLRVIMCCFSVVLTTSHGG